MERQKWDSAIVVITNRCDNLCPGCSSIDLREKTCSGDMSFESFRRITDIFVDQGGLSLDLLGGETTLNPKFLLMTEYAIRKGLDVWLYNNFRAFGRKPELALKVRELADSGKLIIVGKLNVDDPVTSISKRQLQASLIGAGEKAVDQMWNGLKNLLTLDFPKGTLGVENLIRKQNIEYAPAVYELGLKQGFFVDAELPNCCVDSTLEGFKKWIEVFPTRSQILTFLEQIELIDGEYGKAKYKAVPPHLMGRNEELLGVGCTFKSGSLLIESDGSIRLCTASNLLKDRDGSPHNIFIDELDVILSHEAVVRRRQSIIRENISGFCGRCELFKTCTGGCAAMKEALFGDPCTSYPICHRIEKWPTAQQLIIWFKKSHGFNMEDLSLKYAPYRLSY